MTRNAMSEVRGFNYQGSWGTSGLDLWQHHDNGTMAVEVARGKKYFPGWNVARWWLSHEAYHRNPERFLANFEAGLAIFARHRIDVMPVLFNRWRDPMCDFGGVSVDHIVPDLGLFYVPSDAFSGLERSNSNPFQIVEQVFGDFLENVVGPYATDERIFAWDLCNEPLPGTTPPDNVVRRAEVKWLKWCGEVCRASGATQPLTIGSPVEPGDLVSLELIEPIMDFLSFHPYHAPGESDPREFEEFLDEVGSYAASIGKELLATETVWGHVNDTDRVALMRYNLAQLADRGIGFIAHALHHSLVADLHAAEYGPITFPGRLEFIEADGSLRQGHEAFNEF